MKQTRYLRPRSSHMVSVIVAIVVWIPQTPSFLNFSDEYLCSLIRECHSARHCVVGFGGNFESETASRLNGPRGESTPRQLASRDHASVTDDHD